MRATLGENASSLISACLVLVLIGGVACYCYYSLPSAIDGGGLQYYGFYLHASIFIGSWERRTDQASRCSLQQAEAIQSGFSWGHRLMTKYIGNILHNSMCSFDNSLLSTCGPDIYYYACIKHALSYMIRYRVHDVCTS